MEPNVLIGATLIAAGIADLGMAFFLGQRIDDKQKRLILLTALVSGSVLMIGLGAAFLFGLLGA